MSNGLTTLRRVVAPCCEEARGNVSTFSSDNFPDVSELKKGNLVSNCRYVKTKFTDLFILDSVMYHMPHLYL